MRTKLTVFYDSREGTRVSGEKWVDLGFVPTLGMNLRLLFSTFQVSGITYDIHNNFCTAYQYMPPAIYLDTLKLSEQLQRDGYEVTVLRGGE